MKINELIDHTLLKADANEDSIKKLCEEAIKYNFKSVCINPSWVSLAKDTLKNSNVLVCTVIGFPLGANTSKTKVFESLNAIENGADELDIVVNIGWVKSNKFDLVAEELREIRKNIKEKTLKLILETALLSEIEIVKLCKIAQKEGFNYVKTSTGFSVSGANIKDINIMHNIVKDTMGIKASGGIRDLETAKKMLDAGANRLGLSSSIKIVEELNYED
ncbi:MAG: deoxyribose-phosphate aldolase [Peptoniphilaceae bacterium]